MAYLPIKDEKKSWKVYRKPHEGRGNKNNKNYKFYNSSRWRKLSKAYEKRHPNCEACAKNGIIKDATGRKGVTDHIYSVNEAPELSLKWANLQRLCHSCHNAKSAIEGHKNKDNEK